MTQYCRTWSAKKKNINVWNRGNVKERKLNGKVNEIQKVIKRTNNPPGSHTIADSFNHVTLVYEEQNHVILA